MSLENMTPEQIESLATLSKRLSENPETRKSFQKLIKQDNPKLSIPEIDAESMILEQMAERDKRLEAFEESQRQRDIAAQRDKIRAGLEKKGFVKSDEDFEKIEKLMVEKGIANHETAAQFIQHESRSAEPSVEAPSRGGNVKFPDEWKSAFKNPGRVNQVARDLAHQAVTEVLRNRAR